MAQTLTKEAKPLDTYSIEEQEEIAFWLRLVKQWQGYRNKPGANKTEVDANFVQWCKLEYPERAISVDTLYRRWNAVRDNDLDGLIDKRGKWKKGKSSIPDPMWQAFLQGNRHRGIPVSWRHRTFWQLHLQRVEWTGVQSG